VSGTHARWREIRDRLTELDTESQALHAEWDEIRVGCYHPSLPKRIIPDDVPYSDTCPDCGFTSYCHVW
jgi:hypothetical protein